MAMPAALLAWAAVLPTTPTPSSTGKACRQPAKSSIWALQLWRRHRQGALFLLLFFVDPHDPYHAPKPFDGFFVSDLKVPLIQSPAWETGRYSRAEITRMQETYDGALRYTDSEIGRFIENLKTMGLYEQSTLIVTSDHGEAFGEHGVFLHGHHLYDELVRAPLIVRTPHMSRRKVAYAGMAQSLDLLPTVLALNDLPAVPNLPGKDLLAALAHPNGANQTTQVAMEFNNFGIHRRALRSHTHKVVQELKAHAPTFAASVGAKKLLPSVHFDADRWHAYDLVADPFEQQDDAVRLFKGAAAAKLKADLAARPWPQVEALHASDTCQAGAATKRHTRAAEPNRTAVMDPETYDDLKTLGYIQ